MSIPLQADLKRLQSLAYHRSEWSQPLIRKFHKLSSRAKKHPDFPKLKKLHAWLLAPITLWPANLDAVGHQVIDTIRSGKRLDRKLSFF